MTQYFQIIIDFIRQYFPDYTVKFYNGNYNYFDQDTNTIYITKYIDDNNEHELVFIITQLMCSKLTDDDLKNIVINDNDIGPLKQLRNSKTPYNMQLFCAIIVYLIMGGTNYNYIINKIPNFIIDYIISSYWDYYIFIDRQLYMNIIYNNDINILETFILCMEYGARGRPHDIFLYMTYKFNYLVKDKKLNQEFKALCDKYYRQWSNSDAYTFTPMIKLYHEILKLMQSNKPELIQIPQEDKGCGNAQTQDRTYKGEDIQEFFNQYKGFLNKLKPLVDVIKENEKTRDVVRQLSGKLNKRALFKIPQGNTRIFKRTIDYAKDNKDLHVLLLVDISGSMIDRGGSSPINCRITPALTSALAFATALEQAGKSSSVMTFGYSTALLKGFNNKTPKIHDIAQAIKTEGGTDGFRAMKRAIQYMENMTDSDSSRVIIMLTDGSFDLNDINRFKEIVKKSNIKIYGISLVENDLQHYLANVEHIIEPTQENIFNGFKAIFKGIANNGNKTAI